jgi:hypothetical protein
LREQIDSYGHPDAENRQLHPFRVGDNRFSMKILLAVLALSAHALGKDKDIPLEECPAPVKATIAEYAKKFSFEKVELEGKTEPQIYGAKFLSPDGRRFELIMGADGKVQRTELKKPKKEK